MLNEKQLKCIDLMSTTNLTQKKIAVEIDVAEKTICEWKKQDEFKKKIQESIHENFGSLALEAQKELKNLLHSKNEFIRIQAVKDVLDRAGFKPVEKFKGEVEASTKFADVCKQLGGEGLHE